MISLRILSEFFYGIWSDDLFLGGTFTEDYYRFCIIKCVFEGASKDQFVPMLMFAFSIFGSEGLYVTKKGIFSLGLG